MVPRRCADNGRLARQATEIVRRKLCPQSCQIWKVCHCRHSQEVFQTLFLSLDIVAHEG
jgi:hypothetical protein